MRYSLERNLVSADCQPL